MVTFQRIKRAVVIGYYYLKRVFLRRHPSAEHKKSWDKFESAVMY